MLVEHPTWLVAGSWGYSDGKGIQRFRSCVQANLLLRRLLPLSTLARVGRGGHKLGGRLAEVMEAFARVAEGCEIAVDAVDELGTRQGQEEREHHPKMYGEQDPDGGRG